MRTVVLPDKPVFDPDDPMWPHLMDEPYALYFLTFGKEEVGQGVSVAVQLESGLVLPPLVAGAVISNYEELSFFTVEIVQELVRRVYEITRECEVVINEGVEDADANATQH